MMSPAPARAPRDSSTITAGDGEQLNAVEGGGGFALHARELGYVQLAEAVRFDEQWEQDASLGLRAGQRSALLEYHDRGRITGAEPEQAMDLARAVYVSHYLEGTRHRDLNLDRSGHGARGQASGPAAQRMVPCNVEPGGNRTASVVDWDTRKHRPVVACASADGHSDRTAPGWRRQRQRDRLARQAGTAVAEGRLGDGRERC